MMKERLNTIMKLCKKEYKKPPIFPKWAGVNPELADKKIYYLYKKKNRIYNF